MTIDALPAAPDPSDSQSVFDAKMFAFLAAMVPLPGQVNDTTADAQAAATAADAARVLAQAARDLALTYRDASAANAAAAAASAGGTAWASGSYSIGVRATSPSNQRLYSRRSPGGASPTDPALDPTNWKPVPIDLPVDTVTGTTGTIRANVRTRCTNAAAVALTFPTLDSEDVIEIDFENGRLDNSFDLGAQTIKGPNGSTATGVITHTAGGFLRLYFNGTHIRSAQ